MKKESRKKQNPAQLPEMADIAPAMQVTNEDRARKWLKETWPWSLDQDGPSEREVRLLVGLLTEVRDASLEEAAMIADEREPRWNAGAIGRIPDDDSLVYRDDATYGLQFYAGSVKEAEAAARILNVLQDRVDRVSEILAEHQKNGDRCQSLRQAIEHALK